MMIKKYSFLILILTTLFTYGQGIVFQKNESSTASELLAVQKLNKVGDSLILVSDSEKITQVDILNEDYLETIKVDSVKGNINLKKLPIGNYVVQAKVGTNWIVMYLEKINNITVGLNLMDIKINLELNNLDLGAKKIKKNTVSPQRSLFENALENSTMYWVVYESNSQFSSVKTMSLKYAHEIYDLIYKSKLEVKTKIGKKNKLSVYEVYNTSEFMSKQIRNRKFYKNNNSKLFNVLPLYESENERNDLNE